MKKIKFSLIVISLLSFVTFMSCGTSGETEKEKDENTSSENNTEKVNPFKALAKVGAEMKEAAENLEKMQNTEGGETLNYEDLIKFLPEEIDGYTRNEPEGGTMSMQGFSYSNATVEFTNENGNEVKVTILDYNAAVALYTAATAMWAMGMKIDTSDELAGAVSMDNGVKGWEVYKKKSHDASVVLGVGSRFLVTVDADNQDDTEFVKEIAKEIDLEELIANK